MTDYQIWAVDRERNAEARKARTKKCKYCKGKKMVSLGEGIRGLQECPYCNGTGVQSEEKKVQK